MTNLPTNPTKTDLLEQHWYEFLCQVKKLSAKGTDGSFRYGYYSPTENDFWAWFLAHKLVVKDAGAEPS